MIPNGCEDGEANCKPLNNRYTQFDQFLAREVPLIESSPAFGDDGVIVVTYDEDQRMGGLAAKNGLGSGGHVVCALISPLVPAGRVRRQDLLLQRAPHDPGRLRARSVPRRRSAGGAASRRLEIAVEAALASAVYWGNTRNVKWTSSRSDSPASGAFRSGSASASTVSTNSRTSAAVAHMRKLPIHWASCHSSGRS